MFFIQKIKLNFEQEACDPFEKTIISGKDEFDDYYQKETELLKFEIPIYGRYELLNYSPSSRIMFSNFKNKKIRLCNDNLLIEIPSIYNDNFKNAIDEYKQIKNLINKNVENINNDISNFNNSLKPYITTIFKNEKDNLLKKYEMLSKFEIPIKNN